MKNETERILSTQKNFIGLNICFILGNVIYILAFSSKVDGRTVNYLFGQIAVILGNFVLLQFRYFDQKSIYKIYSFFTITYYTVMIFAFRPYLSYVGMLSLFSFLFGFYLSIGTKTSKNKKDIIGLQTTSFILAGIVSVVPFHANYEYTYAIFLLIFLCVVTYLMYGLFFKRSEELNGIIVNKIQLFEESKISIEQLERQQAKFKKNNEEMAKQKYDLEQANKDLSKLTAEFFTQNELLQYISSVLDIEELMDVVTDAILGTTGVDSCYIVLYDEQKEEYIFASKPITQQNIVEELKTSIKMGELEEYFSSKKVHLNNNINYEEYPFVKNRDVKSIAVIPLIRENLTYGLLIAEHATVGMFTDSNVQFFRGIASQITIAVNNANLYARMEDMAVKDGLTGIYNRTYLQDHILSYVEQADNRKNSVCMVLFDIDKFKLVNDNYGHLFGDKAIKMVACQTLKVAKKYNGIAARYGGEEFVLLLQDMDIESSKMIVEELHEAIKNQKLEYETETVQINVSIGVTSYPEVANNVNELFNRADNAMYFSKKQGRGRITYDKKDFENVLQ